MKCIWSRWFTPKEKWPIVGMYIQIEQSCSLCEKKGENEGIVSGFNGMYLKMIPAAEIFCRGCVKRWRFRIEGPELQSEREVKEKEMA
jgi:hypothetical protein